MVMQLMFAGGGTRKTVPETISGLAARFIADDLIGDVADAAAVASWVDATGNLNDVAHGTAGNRPVFDEVNPQFNGHASVNFTLGSTHYLFTSTGPILTALSGSDVPFTVFAVARRSTKVAANQYCWSLGNSAQASQSYFGGGWMYGSSNSQRLAINVRDDAGTTATAPTGLNEITDLGPQVLTWSMSGTTARTFVAGASQNSHYDAYADAISSGGDYSAQGAITFNRFAIGCLIRASASSPATMEVAELLVYNRELSEAERVRVSDYLHNKYCLAPITSAFPARLLSGLTNLWDARSVPNVAGETALTLPVSGGIGSHDFEAASSGVAPTVRVDAATGGKYLEFDGSDNLMTAGAASDWRFLHDGSDFTLAIVYRVPSSASAITPIIDTLANNTANVGFGLYHDAASAAHSFQAKIGNDTTAVLNHDSQDGGSRPDAWHIAMISHEGTIPSTEEHYQIYLDNENYAAIDQAATPIAATDPQGTLTIGGLTGGGTFGRIDIAAILIWNRKLSRPDEVQLANEILANQLGTSHVSLAAGNGFPNLMNDATPHRGFPGLLRTASGLWILIYRRATTHGSSAGVAVMITSGDGYRWSNERVIFDDSSNYDWRGVNAFKQISTGRIFLGMMLSETDSSLLPYTSAFLYSDDDGGTWTGPVFVSNATDAWFDGLGTDTGVEWDESPNALVELSNGTLIAHLSITVDGLTYPHICQIESTDGGDTWSEPQPIWFGRETGLSGNFPQDERIQEPFSVLFADGEILLAIRADYVPVDNPTGRIYFARSDDGGVTWTPEDFSTEFVEGYGNPRMIVDPNDPDGVYLFHRTGTTPNIAVWRYSDDRGVTWSDPQPVTNFNDSATTTIGDYGGMTYVFPHYDDDSNVWVALGMEQSNDSDIFVRRWVNAE